MKEQIIKFITICFASLFLGLALEGCAKNVETPQLVTIPYVPEYMHDSQLNDDIIDELESDKQKATQQREFFERVKKERELSE